MQNVLTAAGFPRSPRARYGDGIILASREIGAMTNEILEFQPLLDHVDNADALHAHAAYLHQRGQD